MFPGDGNPVVNITSVVAYNPIDLAEPISLIHTPSGILFSLNVTITTTFDMEPYGSDTIYPSLALQQAHTLRPTTHICSVV